MSDLGRAWRRFWRWRPATVRAVVVWQIVEAALLFAVAFGLRAGTGEQTRPSLLIAAVIGALYILVGLPFALARLRRRQ